MKSLRSRWYIGIGFLALCLSLLVGLIPVISVRAEELETYSFKFYDGFYNNEATIRGNDVDFVSGYLFYHSNFQDSYGNYEFSYSSFILALSYEPFTYDHIMNDKYIITNKSATYKYYYSSSLGKSIGVYYAVIDAGQGGGTDLSKGEALIEYGNYSGLPNFRIYRDDFTSVSSKYNFMTVDFVNDMMEEFVTNGGIDWEDFLHPDDSNISGLGGGDIQDLEAFISDYVLFCSWSGLGGSIPGASTKSFISPTLIFADKDDPENTDLIRQLKYYENFWVSDYSLEINFRSLLEKNEFLYGVRLTPYYYKDDNDINSLVQGSSTTIYFDINGDWDEDKNGPSHGGSSNPPDSSRRFSLTGIYVETTPFSQQIIRWAGTTIDDELSYIPDKNTKVKAYVEWIDADGNYIYEEYENSSTIGKGYLAVYIKPIQTESKNSELSWTGRIRLEPAYTVNNVTYHGKYSYVDFDNELITGGDLGDGSSSDFESILPSDDPISNHFSMSDVADYAELGLGFLSGLLDLMGSFPKLVAAIFSFMPSIYIEAIGAFILIIFIARILGR